nr:MAG TPA: hypothetical protein [Caudoviricetes sp.]
MLLYITISYYYFLKFRKEFRVEDRYKYEVFVDRLYPLLLYDI